MNRRKKSLILATRDRVSTGSFDLYVEDHRSEIKKDCPN